MPRLRLLYVLIISFVPLLSFAQTVNDYRSAGTGSWTTLATWQRWSGAAWLTPTIGQGTPTSGANVITIQVGHIVNVPNGSTITIDQTTVAGTLQIDNGGAIIIAAGAGTDFTVSTGAVNVSGTVTLNQNTTTSGTSSSNTSFLSGSRYRHLWVTLGVVPLATWDVNSTMEIAGFTGSVSFTALANWNQAFGNFEVNLTVLGNNRDVDANGLLNLAGNLTVTSTGGSTGSFRLNNGQTTTMVVGGALIINGTSNVKFNRNGILSLTVGSFSMASSGTATITELSPGSTTFDVLGNFSFTSGTITKGNNAGAVANIRFTGSSPQTFVRSGTATFTQAVGFNVLPTAIVDMGISSINGPGTFILSGELRVGSVNANGAIQLTTGAGSNLQNTGLRTYNTGSTIRYNGAGIQYIGNGHPTVTSPGVNLIIDNASGVSLAAAVAGLRVTGNLTLNSGILDVSAKALTLDGNIIQNSVSSTIAVNATTDITINGNGALGTFPFAAGAQSFRSFTLNRLSSGSVVFANDLTLIGVVTLTNGIMNFSGQSMTLNGTFVATSGFLYSDASSNLSIGGTGALGTLVFDPAGNQLSTLSLNRVGAGTASLGSPLTVNVALDLLNGDFTNGGGLTLADGAILTRASSGQLLGSRPIASGTYDINYQGTAMTTGLELPDPINTTALNNLTINGGTVTLNQDLTINGDFTINSNDLDAGSFTITMKGATWNLTGGLFTPSSSLVIFDGATSVTFASDFNNIQLNTARSLDFPTDLVNVSGNIDFASGSTFNANSGTVGLNGSGDQSINGNATEFYAIQVSKSAGAVNINSALPLLHLLDVQTATTVNTNGHLTIRSRGNTTDLDASIGPLAGGATINGNVRVQRYMHAFGFSANRYISVPVSGATPNNAFADNFTIANGSIRYYNEPTKSYFNQPLTSTLLQGKGYLIWMYNGAATVVWDATGPIYQGSLTLPVSLTIEGWNLVGNPYASAIHWSNDLSAWTRSADISPVVYVSDLLSNEFIVFNYADNSGEGGIIAMGQSFWVKANAASPSLMIHEPAKTSAPGGSFYRTSANSTSEQLIMSIQNDKYKDRSYLKINEKASEDFDHLYDGEKLKNEFLNIYFYDKSDRSLVMHTLNSIPYEAKIPVVIEATEPGDYQVSFSNTENFSAASSLYLVDAWEGKAMAVTSGESYKVQITESTKTISDRFYLSRNPQIPERKMNDLVIAYPNPVKDQLYLRIPANRKAKVSLSDSQGTTLWLDEMQGERMIDFRNYPNGMFILKVSDGHEVVTRKIVKQ